MKNMIVVSALIAWLAMSGAETSQAALVYNSANGSVTGDVRVTQTVIGTDWVNILIEVQTSQTFDTISGGFRTVGSGVFSQGAGPLSTEFQFSNATGTPVAISEVRNATELSLESRAQLFGTFGPANQFNSFAQLVLAPGTSAEIFSLPTASGVSSSQFALVRGGNVVGTLSGTVTAVPEPATLTTLAVFGAGWFGRIVRRRRQLAIAG